MKHFHRLQLIVIGIVAWFSFPTATPAEGERPLTGGQTPNVSRLVTVHVELDGDPVSVAVRGRTGAQLAAQAPSARARAARILEQHDALAAPLADLGARVTGRFSRVANVLRVQVPEEQLPQLEALPGVRRLQRVRLYSRHLTTSVPFVGAPAAWGIPPDGIDGRGIRIGIVDSGIDYTHAAFGGSGSVADFTANDPTRIEPGTFPTAKVVGGFDFSGDAYNPNDNANETPLPDNDPLDCAANGHGTHVAGIAAGLGVLTNGATYRGEYSATPDMALFSIGPGVAPRALLYALKVFGCTGSTALVTDALEWASDPNGDYDFSDRLDVVNLSLGGDFGTLDPEDSDIAAANRLAELGCVVVCSAGNSENIFFAVGAPGVADRALSVANSISKGLGKALAVLSPPAIAGNYFMVEGALTPALTNAGPVSGQIIAMEPSLGCEPPSNAESLRGHIALIDRGTCLFSEKILHAQAAGAIAVVMVNNLDTAPIAMGGESNGIQIPGVMISKADGEWIRTQLGATVTIRLDPELTVDRVEFVDTLEDASSRGPGSPHGILKPEISAPGATILSAEAGSGTGAVSQSGTSMSSPVVAGAAALVRQRRPEWSVEEIKAALMNTAKPIASSEGVPYPESRMGAGRLRVAEAVRARVTAFADSGEGRVSVAFGAWTLAGPRDERLPVRLVNHSDRDATFRVAFSNSVSQAGVRFIAVDDTISVPALGSAVTAVRCVADPEAFDPLPDGTTAAVIGAGAPLSRHFLYEASGQLWFLGDDESLHVPCHVNVRAASDFRAETSRIVLPVGDSTLARPPVTLRFLGGSRSTNLFPIVSAFQLGETSPDKRLRDPNRAAVDLLAVGAATDIASVKSFDDSSIYFGIATAGPWSTPQAEINEFDVLIDLNGDGWEEFGIFNGNGSTTNSGGARDAFMSVVLEFGPELEILSTNAVGFLNVYAADKWETAVFNNSVMILPVPAGAIGLRERNSSFRYKVHSFTQSGSVDRTGWIPFDAARPVLDTTFSSPDGTPFHNDGFPFSVRVDREAARDSGHRLPAVLLLRHFGLPERRMEIVTLDLENDDSDNDQLPDWWEQRYFSGINVAGGDTDTDGDGATDRQEYVSRTHPNDSLSAFRMRSATRVSTRNIAVRWSSIAGQVFALERSTNLLAGFNEVVRDNVNATPPQNAVTDTNAPNPGPYFYRVRLRD